MSTPTRLEDEADLDAFVEEHDVALVEFYTEGCSMCAAMEPVLGNVARALRAKGEARDERAADSREQATDVAVGLANPRDDPVLIDRFDVRSVPTLVLFVDGEQVARKAEGFQGASDVVAFLEEHAPGNIAVTG